MQTRVNGKFLACLLLASAVLAVGGYLLHAFQVRRSAGDLLVQATAAEEQGQLFLTADYLRLYLGYMPEDADARARYGLALARLAQSPKARRQAMEVLETALRNDPGRRDVRRRLAELAIQTERFADAREHLQALLTDSPDNGEVEHLLGECERAAGEHARAAEWFEKAARHAPGQVESFVRLAGLLRSDLDQPRRAEKVLDDMVTANPHSFVARLARARDRMERDSLEQADQDSAEALRLAPKDVHVLLTAAELALAHKDSASARRLLSRATELHPEDVRPYHALARLEIREGKREAAAALLRRTVKLDARPPQLWEAADLLIELDQVSSAREMLTRLRRDGALAAPVQYLEARLLVRQGLWVEASKKLEAASPLLVQQRELSGLAPRADLLLGQCYRELGNPDLQFAAYRRAVQADPSWAPARVSLASALLSLGRFEEATEEYRRLAPTLPGSQLMVARLLILRNLQLAPEKRQWREVEQALAEADRARQSPDEVAILRAELLAAQDRIDDARRLLEAERDRRPTYAPFWVALGELARRQGNPARGVEVLQEGRRRLGDPAELRLALARHLARRGDAEARKSLAELEQGLKRYSATDQANLLRTLADAHLGLGESRAAERLLQQLARIRPHDLPTRLALFDLALQAADGDAMKQAIEAVRHIEGPGGPLYCYGEAARLIARARHGDRNGLAEARAYLVEVAAQRPSWSRLALLQAELEEEEGKYDAAIDSYVQAVDQGERQPEVIRRVVQLLYERQRYQDAEQVLRKLTDQDEALISGDLGRLAAEVSLRTQNYTRAIELAHQAVSSRSRDYRDHVWLGQILWAVGRKAEAQAALERATKDFGQVPDTWVALVQFLHQSGQDQKAEAAIQQTARKLPSEQGVLALAQCHEVLGHKDRAEEYYRAALKARPDAVAVLQPVADYLLHNGQPHLAVPLLRRVLEPRIKASPAETTRARRSLAFALATGGGYQGFQEALALIEENLKTGGNSAEDQRCQALVLATQPGQRREASRLLEDSFRRKPPTPEEVFLLARLYEADQDWPRSRELMLRLLAGREVRADHVASYMASLLERGEPGEARIWLARLEKLEPASYRTLERKARVLAGENRSAEAVRLLVEHARKQPGDTGRVAALLDRLGQGQPAEEAYRQFASTSQQPEAQLALAEFLGRHKRVGEALAVCEQACGHGADPAAAALSVAVLRAGQASPEDARRVERLLQRLLERGGQQPSLLLSLAELRDLQGRYREAKALYREVLKREAGNLVALNNLAWLLALEEGNAAEALVLIDQGLATAGPAGGLLDTRAVVRLAGGQVGPAIVDLEQALAETPTPARYFHLAQAQRQAGNQVAAMAALRKARALGLEPASLHPLEHEAYRQVLVSLNPT